MSVTTQKVPSIEVPSSMGSTIISPCPVVPPEQASNVQNPSLPPQQTGLTAPTSPLQKPATSGVSFRNNTALKVKPEIIQHFETALNILKQHPVGEGLMAERSAENQAIVETATHHPRRMIVTKLPSALEAGVGKQDLDDLKTLGFNEKEITDLANAFEKAPSTAEAVRGLLTNIAKRHPDLKTKPDGDTLQAFWGGATGGWINAATAAGRAKNVLASKDGPQVFTDLDCQMFEAAFALNVIGKRCLEGADIKLTDPAAVKGKKEQALERYVQATGLLSATYAAQMKPGNDPAFYVSLAHGFVHGNFFDDYELPVLRAMGLDVQIVSRTAMNQPPTSEPLWRSGMPDGGAIRTELASDSAKKTKALISSRDVIVSKKVPTPAHIHRMIAKATSNIPLYAFRMESGGIMAQWDPSSSDHCLLALTGPNDAHKQVKFEGFSDPAEGAGPPANIVARLQAYLMANCIHHDTKTYGEVQATLLNVQASWDSIPENIVMTPSEVLVNAARVWPTEKKL